MQDLNDYNAEQIVLGSLIKDPKECFYKCDEYISADNLFYTQHQAIYHSFEELINSGLENISKVDLLSHLKNNYQKLDNKFDFTEMVEELQNYSVTKDNLPKYCEKISSLHFARKLKTALKDSSDAVSNITGEEKLSEILALAEHPIHTCSQALVYDSDVVDLASIADDYISHIAETRPTQKGIPTGFPIFDRCIGGGLIKPGVHLVGARSKVGKSFMGAAVSVNVSGENIPVLYLDTELTKEQMLDRMLANISDVEINNLNTGLFQDSEEMSRKVSEGLKEFKKRRITYRNISGVDHKEWISTIRRWIVQEVGFNEDGTTKDCLVVLDYIKTMDLSHLGKFSEWQYLGQVITDLHNLCIKYNFPIFALAQLNRDGIAGEGQGVISGSDRLIFLCSSFSILKKKDAEDLVADPCVDLPGIKSDGSTDRKLIVVATRNGPGLEEGTYINIHTDLSRAKMIEGKTNVQNRTQRSSKKNFKKKYNDREVIPEEQTVDEIPF